MRRLLPAPVTDLDRDALVSHYAYPDAGAVRANMVTSLDGAVTVDGRSRGLSGEADREVFRVLRSLADVVLVGAGTVRAEDYGPAVPRPELAHHRGGRDPAPTIAVVTRTGDLDPSSRLFADPTARPVVLTCQAAPEHRLAALQEVADVVRFGDDDVDLLAAVGYLTSERRWHRVLAEGGPSLLGALAADDLLDELALTLAPLLVGGEGGRMVATSALPPTSLALRGLVQSDDVLFALYHRERR